MFYLYNSQLKTKTMKLLKVETGKKSAKFSYSIVDENGNVLSTRSSNREYVAATICGTFFFGRLDLIGKGDHGGCMKSLHESISRLSKLPENQKHQYRNMTNGEVMECEKNQLKKYQTIAK